MRASSPLVEQDDDRDPWAATPSSQHDRAGKGVIRLVPAGEAPAGGRETFFPDFVADDPFFVDFCSNDVVPDEAFASGSPTAHEGAVSGGDSSASAPSSSTSSASETRAEPVVTRQPTTDHKHDTVGLVRHELHQPLSTATTLPPDHEDQHENHDRLATAPGRGGPRRETVTEESRSSGEPQSFSKRLFGDLFESAASKTLSAMKGSTTSSVGARPSARLEDDSIEGAVRKTRTSSTTIASSDITNAAGSASRDYSFSFSGGSHPDAGGRQPPDTYTSSRSSVFLEDPTSGDGSIFPSAPPSAFPSSTTTTSRNKISTAAARGVSKNVSSDTSTISNDPPLVQSVTSTSTAAVAVPARPTLQAQDAETSKNYAETEYSLSDSSCEGRLSAAEPAFVSRAALRRLHEALPVPQGLTKNIFGATSTASPVTGTTAVPPKPAAAPTKYATWIPSPAKFSCTPKGAGAVQLGPASGGVPLQPPLLNLSPRALLIGGSPGRSDSSPKFHSAAMLSSRPVQLRGGASPRLKFPNSGGGAAPVSVDARPRRSPVRGTPPEPEPTSRTSRVPLAPPQHHARRCDYTNKTKGKVPKQHQGSDGQNGRAGATAKRQQLKKSRDDRSVTSSQTTLDLDARDKKERVLGIGPGGDTTRTSSRKNKCDMPVPYEALDENPVTPLESTSGCGSSEKLETPSGGGGRPTATWPQQPCFASGTSPRVMRQNLFHASTSASVSSINHNLRRTASFQSGCAFRSPILTGFTANKNSAWGTSAGGGSYGLNNTMSFPAATSRRIRTPTTGELRQHEDKASPTSGRLRFPDRDDDDPPSAKTSSSAKHSTSTTSTSTSSQSLTVRAAPLKNMPRVKPLLPDASAFGQRSRVALRRAAHINACASARTATPNHLAKEQFPQGEQLFSPAAGGGIGVVENEHDVEAEEDAHAIDDTDSIKASPSPLRSVSSDDNILHDLQLSEDEEQVVTIKPKNASGEDRQEPRRVLYHKMTEEDPEEVEEAHEKNAEQFKSCLDHTGVQLDVERPFTRGDDSHLSSLAAVLRGRSRSRSASNISSPLLSPEIVDLAEGDEDHHGGEQSSGPPRNLAAQIEDLVAQEHGESARAVVRTTLKALQRVMDPTELL